MFQNAAMPWGSHSSEADITILLKCPRFHETQMFIIVCTIHQQIHYSENLLIHSTAPICFDVCTSTSGSFLLSVRLSYIKNTRLFFPLFNCNWVDTRWQWYSTHTHKQNTEYGGRNTLKNYKGKKQLQGKNWEVH
jgi:hypothetical protein